jgi:hypothetical protein
MKMLPCLYTDLLFGFLLHETLFHIMHTTTTTTTHIHINQPHGGEDICYRIERGEHCNIINEIV